LHWRAAECADPATVATIETISGPLDGFAIFVIPVHAAW
jgi:hypothetical protein